MRFIQVSYRDAGNKWRKGYKESRVIKMLSNKKGYIYFGVGSLFLLLIVVFVVIWLTNKPMAIEITEGIGNLSSAAGHLVKYP